MAACRGRWSHQCGATVVFAGVSVCWPAVVRWFGWWRGVLEQHWGSWQDFLPVSQRTDRSAVEWVRVLTPGHQPFRWTMVPAWAEIYTKVNTLRRLRWACSPRQSRRSSAGSHVN